MNKSLLALLSSFFVFIPISSLFSQQYPLGLNPNSLKWKQINTEKVQVVFPEGVEGQGKRVANLIEYLYSNNLESIGSKSEKVTILMQNQTGISNGFVTLSPFRSEFFLTPPQFNFLGSGNWLDLLAIHEYRHVQQTTNAKRGITNFFYTILGENTLSFFRRTALPRWYIEGDAVSSETALSESGRGRTPAFDMEYRALRLAGRKFNYEKASATSIKEFVPNHYNQGYYLINYARANFGEDIWKNTLENAVKYKGLFFPFSHSLKKSTNMRTPQLYNAAFAELDEKWEEELEDLTLTPSVLVNTKAKQRYTNYRFPNYISNNQLIVEKSGFKDIRSFYTIDGQGTEKKITLPGYNLNYNSTLSLAENKIVWADIEYDIRWGNVDYSVIKIYDLNTGKTTQLTKKTKYFAPALSPDASKIVVAEATLNGDYALIILDAITGEVIRTLPNSENLFYSLPKWTKDGKAIVTVAQKGHKQAIVLVNVEDGGYNALTSFGNDQVSYPFDGGEYVYFSAAYSGINNIYAVNKITKEFFQVTSSKIGAFQPALSPDGLKLAYAEYSADGYDIKEVSLENRTYASLDKIPESSLNFYEAAKEQEGGSILNKIPSNEFEIKKYKKTTGLLRPHSIQVFPNHPVYRAEVQMENKFQTFNGAVGYQYNANENAGGFYMDVLYAQFFPVMNGSIGIQNTRSRTNMYIRKNSEDQPDLGFYTKKWKEDDYRIGLFVPLNLSDGNHFANLRIGASYHYLNVNYDNVSLGFNESLQARNGPVNVMDFRVRFSRQQSKAMQFINSRFAQALEVNYLSTFKTNRNQGSQFTSTATFFFPGIWKNHSFFVEGSFQKEGFTDTYQFRDSFRYARGYNSIPHDDIIRGSVNYALPLFYPDVALGPLAFVQRVKLNLFFDYSRTSFDPVIPSQLPNDSGLQVPSDPRTLLPNETYNSTGAELSFDFRALRLIDLDLGVRYSYLLDTSNIFSAGLNKHQFDFLILRIGG
ncbi:hypothetical protein [Flexithrix dorotheae]|uniref:hypothetical protein n=1 Tax=Flexithrix dorotheae TaxID=70993 RepID=UPI00036AEBEF|nr:hypothetical protein [Flexithrix dorotheae]